METEGDSHVVRATVDDRPPSAVIVSAVAALTDRRPESCPPLYDVVDPEALDALFADRHGGEVRFEYAGCRVTVVDGATVTVEWI